MPSRAQDFDPRQYMKRDTYELFRYKGAYPREVALHHHDFYEVYFFLSGNVRYNIESRSYLLAPGDVLLISPYELHQPVFSGESRVYERYVLWINKGYLESLSTPGQNLAACFDTAAPGHSSLLRPEETARQWLRYQLDQLMEESDCQDFGSDYMALSYLVQALVLLNRQALRPGRESEPRPSPDALVYRVLGYINEHYSEELSLDDLAGRFFLSKYHLEREFQRLVGVPVHRYIVQKRLAMARRMMEEGRSAKEVYSLCGFGDYSNFYRAFRGEYQISPREFTARLKQAQPPQDDLGRRIRQRVTKA